MTLLDTKTCPKCEGQMTYGRMRSKEDATTHYWTALKEETIFGRRALVDDGKPFPARAYRCQQCGFVEVYASEEGES
jgi:predicted nucleic-acid-binding Zn-ribbon protein